MGDYLEAAKTDARDAAENFLDEIVDNIVGNEGEISETDISDYSDSYHHETHVDRSYSLKEAAELLDDLDDYEEDDSGLWQGLEPREAISAMAAFTYGNAVASMFRDLMGEVNTAITTAMEDGELLWTLEEKISNEGGSKRRGKGVLDWMPKHESLENVDPDKLEELEEKYNKEVEAQVKKIVEAAIKAY